MVQSTLALVLTGLAATVAAQSCDINDLSVSYPAPEAHSDWTYRLIARDLTKPRSILFDSESNLIVLDAGEGIVHFNFDDEGDTCLSVNEQTTLLEDEDLNHGLALSDDGETLYASTMDEVYSWPYNAQRGELDEDNRRTLVTNMSNSDHTTRTLLLSGNTLIVSRGSDSNQDPDAEDLSSGHSQIRSFNLSSIPDDSPMDFMDGDLWGWGLRNAVGLALDPVHNGLWSVENSVDELHRSGEDIHRDNPGEELNFHGFLNGTFPSPLSENTTENNYGYPLCFALWGTDNFPDLGSLETGDQFPDEDSSDATDESCNEDYVSPVLAFQAHTAPLDILFSEDGSEAFISFHGSWNREDPVGYKIASIAFGDDGLPSAAADSRDSTTDILSTPDLGNCPDDCFRPVGMTWDSEGRMWFASDSTGEIFVMQKARGGGGGGGGNGGSGDGGDSEDGEDIGVNLRAPGVMVAVGAVVAGMLLA